MVNDYLQNREIRTKVGSSYSTWEDILFGISQGSVLGTLLFNIFLCDLFVVLENKYFTSYTDDTTPLVVGSSTEKILSELNEIAEKLFAWFDRNQMKPNFQMKCHLLLSTPHERNIQVSGTTIKSSKCKKLLSVHFDNKPKFDTHIEIICKKANRKLSA